jgi:dephospho-CoA kinase
MRVIGVVGGIGSGKSCVAEQFARLGAQVIRADEIGHEVLRSPDVRDALSRRWGPAVLASDGQIDRAAVARIVFDRSAAGQAELRFLESVTHPRIEASMRARLDQLARQGNVPAVVVDAAVLLEAGWDRMCDVLVFVDASRAQRIARVCGRGWTAADIASREAAQLSVEEKRKVADGVIDNSGSIDHTFAQVQQFWQSLHLSPPDEPIP